MPKMLFDKQVDGETSSQATVTRLTACGCVTGTAARQLGVSLPDFPELFLNSRQKISIRSRHIRRRGQLYYLHAHLFDTIYSRQRMAGIFFAFNYHNPAGVYQINKTIAEVLG